MAPRPGRIELRCRHRALEELPTCCEYGKTKPSSKFLTLRAGSNASPALGDNGDYSQHHGSAQYFDRVATHANIRDALPLPRCPDIHLAWTTAFDALSNEYVLIAVCDSVLDHPTGSAAGGRSCRGIFATIKEHASSSFKPAFGSFWAQKVEKSGASILQKFRCLCVTKLEFRECLLIAKRHNRKGQSCRHRLDRPFRRNLVNCDSNHGRDVFSRKWTSEFRIALTHFTKHLTVHSISDRIAPVRGEAHGNLPGFQVERDF